MKGKYTRGCCPDHTVMQPRRRRTRDKGHNLLRKRAELVADRAADRRRVDRQARRLRAARVLCRVKERHLLRACAQRGCRAPVTAWPARRRLTTLPCFAGTPPADLLSERRPAERAQREETDADLAQQGPEQQDAQAARELHAGRRKAVLLQHRR